MKRFYGGLVILSILLALIKTVSAQSWKIIVQPNSGFFHFKGDGANTNADRFNAYGTQPGVSYGIGIDFQRINHHRIRFGLSIDFESLQSKATFSFKDLNNVAWEGRIFLRHNFFTLNPYLSYHWKAGPFSMNLQGGIAIALNTGPAKKNYKSMSENGYVESYREDRSTTVIDLRPNLQLNIFKNQLGVGLGYSSGIWDYKFGWVGGTNLIFSRYLKFSLQYQLNKKPKP